MATTRKTATKAKAKPAPAPVVEEVEELEESEVEEITEAETFGVAGIVALINEGPGKNTTTRELRVLLRKMARDGRLDREIVAGNRARWEFSGPEDPQVKAILKAYKAGELEADKKEKLDALKARKAEQKAAAAAAADDEVEDDDEELEED